MQLKAQHVFSLLLPSLASAWGPPGYSGFGPLYQEPFAGAAGSGVNESAWKIVTNLHVNNEVQTYTTSRSNLQISGGGTVQIVPMKDSSGKWTSARIESKFTFTPKAGKITLAESRLRFGTNPASAKQGIWPAVWLLGGSFRNGVAWPACGELDLMEAINGIMKGYGTAHCGTAPGGPCNEPTGLSGNSVIPDNSWHIWRIQFDRRATSWTGQTITWFRDGVQFNQISGAKVGTEALWKTIAASPLFFILNVAVGGDWPHPPNSATLGGYGSMMEVAYVALYQN